MANKVMSCGECRFCDTAKSDDLLKDRGECHVIAPGRSKYFWPTWREDWCGEFKVCHEGPLQAAFILTPTEEARR